MFENVPTRRVLRGAQPCVTVSFQGSQESYMSQGISRHRFASNASKCPSLPVSTIISISEVRQSALRDGKWPSSVSSKGSHQQEWLGGMEAAAEGYWKCHQG